MQEAWEGYIAKGPDTATAALAPAAGLDKNGIWGLGWWALRQPSDLLDNSFRHRVEVVDDRLQTQDLLRLSGCRFVDRGRVGEQPRGEVDKLNASGGDAQGAQGLHCGLERRAGGCVVDSNRCDGPKALRDNRCWEVSCAGPAGVVIATANREPGSSDSTALESACYSELVRE